VLEKKKLTVLYFGTYLPEYPRNSVLIKGLRSQGVSVIECHYPLWHGIEPRIGKIKGIRGKISLFISLIHAYISLSIAHHSVSDYDLMVVGYTGHLDVPLARFLSRLRRRPLIFDMFWSMYNSFVEDRGLFSKRSITARILKFIDRYSCTISDTVLLDTQTHIDSVSKKLDIEKERFSRIWVGADEEVFFPIERSESREFTVLFFGTFIPLQGIDTIIKAAKLLEKEEIRFTLIGRGQLSEEIYTLAHTLNLPNCSFIDWVDLGDLVHEIAKSDICLGIFGKSSKALSVIPNKVFDSIACKKPCITEDSPAIREVFTNSKNILLVPPQDEKGLAEAILLLKKDKILRKDIAKNGFSLFCSTFSNIAIGKEIRRVIEKTLRTRYPR
jgi:glycosyltransferase involved in cell wall biosynthesis